MNNDQQSALFRALQAGKLRELVALRGGTGDLRRELRQSRKAKRKQAKASRQFNRRKGA
ncbi:hypothetical protein [Robertmurraya andreesenii]|uniref:30S ribosomal protein S21 n=1 Tax=Anoxybacillus andreesenii TaxID=1325932 RepID=A0ABT9V1X8_9BACL|nr:hypothetical protein [Robertmurraya andreesenii]MDQ0154959.1 hypothetical protein [Robertmurraya andreesenii]